MLRSKRPDGRLIVLQSFPGRGSQTNPYLLLLVDSLPSEIEVRYFSWARALLGRWDVLHVHWPERLLRGDGTLRTGVRRILFALLLVRLRLGRSAVVRTVHNLAPHEPVRGAEGLLLRLLEERTDLRIRLNPFTPVESGAAVRTIVHGHYLDWYAAPRVQRTRGRLLFAGLVRPYKGVEELLAAFAALPRADATLHVCGRPSDARLGAEVTLAASRDHRVTAVLRHLDDAELVEEIGAAQLVVLPYRSVHNSGAAVLALSLSRPVLMPAGEVTAWLRQRVGEAWVQLYRPPLEAEDLRAALDAVEILPEGGPDLEDMAWGPIGAAHADAYRAARDARGA